ncbi:MAG: hypothetical protein M1497_05925 [Nitrospirae bacterium]|nr:hypothetical protein [Nitrospirota bacterium]
MVTSTVENRWCSYAMGFLITVVLAMSFFHLTNVIRDNDFFWHLKSGQWIWENRAFPERDPFAYTTSMLESARVHFVSTSYWLSQVFFYLFFLAGDMPGVVLSRFLIAGLLCFVMVKLQKGDKLLYLSLLVISFALILKSYPFERPQLFSFIFFGAILALLESTKTEREGKTAYFLLPLCMLVWANMHGGYALGIVIMLLYVAMEGLKFSHPSLRPLSGAAYRRLILVCIAAIVVSFVNPGTYHVFSKGVLFQAESAISDNLEFQSTIRIFETYGDHGILVYWFILACTVAALLIDSRRTDITKVALIGCIGYFSFTTVRYVPFFLIAAIPIIGESFSRLRCMRGIRIVLYSSAVALAIFFAAPYTGLQAIKTGEWVDDRKFPVRAADFIEQNDFKGNMYNFFNWGGYLIWRLAPGKKVFIDGRTLDTMLYEQAMFIDKAFVDGQSGMPVWKYLLDEYHVSYIVIPCSSQSRSFPLCRVLMGDRDWALVFLDRASAVFVRFSPLSS